MMQNGVTNEQREKSATFNNLLIKRFSLFYNCGRCNGCFNDGSRSRSGHNLNWSDLNRAGTPGPFILLDKLNTIVSLQLYLVSTNLDAKNPLDNGDVFSETLTLLTNSNSLGAGGTAFGLGVDYRFNVSILGHLTNVIRTPLTLNPNNSVASMPLLSLTLYLIWPLLVFSITQPRGHFANHTLSSLV